MIQRLAIVVVLAAACGDRSPRAVRDAAIVPVDAATAPTVDVAAWRALLPPENLDDWAIDSRVPPIVDEPDVLPHTPAELETWNRDARIAALQGAWVMPESGMQALEIQGTSVRLFDRKGERPATVKFHGPCEVVIDEAGRGGNIYGLALIDGQAVLAMGAMGMRRGRDAVVCAANGQYVVHRGRCRYHDWIFDTWRGARCRLGTSAFSYVDPDFGDRGTVAVDGDTIIDPASRRDRARPVADFATARAIVQAYLDSQDLGHIAALAGGRVGHTETIADAAATIAVDPRGWCGRVLAIRGVVRSWSSVSINGGDPAMSYELTDTADGREHNGSFPTAPHLRCFAAAGAGAPTGNHVVAVGTVTESSSVGEVRLRDCVFSR